VSALMDRMTHPTAEEVVIAFGDDAPGRKLINGRMLTCPGCERQADVLMYVPLNHSTKYAAQIVTPLKCRACRHIFALRP
jgi:hypothetical protein